MLCHASSIGISLSIKGVPIVCLMSIETLLSIEILLILPSWGNQ